MNPLLYFLAYFKTNYFTACFVPFFILLFLTRYVKFRFLSHRVLLVGIIMLGLILRLFWLGFSSYSAKIDWDSKHMLESDVTNVQAIKLTKGIWFHDGSGNPTGRRPIGYPVLLGTLYKVFGVHHRIAYGLNLLLFVWSVYLVFLLGRMLYSERAGLWSVFFYSIYPISVYSINMMTDEHLFVPLFFLGLYFLLKEVHGCPVKWPLLWYGLIFGYATMVRTHSIFTPMTVALAYCLLKYPWKKTVMAFLTVMLLMQIVNLPWAIRNYKAWGTPVIYTATANFVYRTVNSSATPEGGGHIPLKGEEGYSEELERAGLLNNEGLYHNLCNREMMRWITGHPYAFLKLGLCRVIFFMGWNRAGGVWPIWFQYYEGSYDPARPIAPNVKHFLEEAAFLFYYVLFFMFLSSVFFIWRRWKRLSRQCQISLLVLGSVFVFWLLEHMVIYPDRKYRYPLEPLMIVWVSVWLDWIAFGSKKDVP